MEIDEERRKDVLARLRRVEGQVRGVQRMIEEGRACDEVVTQFAAAIRALEHAGYQYFAATLVACVGDPEEATRAGYDPERLERLFMQLT